MHNAIPILVVGTAVALGVMLSRKKATAGDGGNGPGAKPKYKVGTPVIYIPAPYKHGSVLESWWCPTKREFRYTIAFGDEGTFEAYESDLKLYAASFKVGDTVYLKFYPNCHAKIVKVYGWSEPRQDFFYKLQAIEPAPCGFSSISMAEQYIKLVV